MRISQHIYNMHIDDGAPSHPGGSNNFFVGDPEKEMVLIDTGDYQREWTKSILDYHKELGTPKIKGVLITHGHSDHTGGLDRIQDVFKCPVFCHPELSDRLKLLLGDDQVVKDLHPFQKINIADVELQVLFTPGHEIDHVCYYLESDLVMFTGDSVLGASSTSVRHLSSYMESLKLISSYRHDTICPAHGPVVPPPRGSELVEWQINHRTKREEQIIAVLRKGFTTASSIALEIYPRDLDERLRSSAERNVETHLAKLLEDGLLSRQESVYSLLG